MTYAEEWVESFVRRYIPGPSILASLAITLANQTKNGVRPVLGLAAFGASLFLRCRWIHAGIVGARAIVRAIKFRAFDKEERTFKFAERCFDQLGTWISSDLYKVNQYTGLKDKDGREIYEGDILRYCHPNPSANYSFVMEWKIGMTECCQSSFDGYETKDFHVVQVIGNIHENPDILSTENRKI